jgi:hypothetical protein
MTCVRGAPFRKGGTAVGEWDGLEIEPISG